MTDRPKLGGIAHVGIRVRDLDTARRFYELVGFEFVVGPVGPEPVAILDHPKNVVRLSIEIICGLLRELAG